MPRPEASLLPKDVPDWSKFDDLKQAEFAALCSERIKYTKQKAEAETALARINVEIAALLTVISQKNVRWTAPDGQLYTVTQIDGRGPSRLDARLLLGLGVDAGIIEDATVPGKEYVTVQFSPVKNGATQG